ncbi:MAG: thermonuclease family protein [candidate division Zixibacteria bacterium]|nr:thermonuclease family protein [candidate division Zixibacteria bacterium]
MKFPSYILGYGLILLAAFVFASEQVEVKRVIDGDTVELKDGRSVRLIGVDCPERGGGSGLFKDFAEEVTGFLTGLCGGKSVRLEYDRDTIDTYGRTLAYLYLDDGTCVNKELVLRGYGHAPVKYPHRMLAEFLEAESTARAGQLGLWSVPTQSFQLPKGVSDTITVYVTRYGAKYHRSDCDALTKTRMPLTLGQALANGYLPCGVCRPVAPVSLVRVDTVYDTVEGGGASKEGGSFPWVPVIIAVFAAIAAGITAYANYVATDNATRPLLEMTLSGDSVARVKLTVTNLSRTDAEGGMEVRLWVDGREEGIDIPSYCGQEYWSFPADQSIEDSLDLSDVIPTDPRVKGTVVVLEAHLWYRRWYRTRVIFKRGRVYYAPVRRWKFRYEPRKWRPVLASTNPPKPRKPRWEELRKIQPPN